MTIRDTVPEDASEVASLVDSVAKERRYLASTKGFSSEATKEFIEFLRSSGGIHLVATSEKIVAGWCDISPLPFEGMEHVGKLGMGVAPEHRGKGIGASLLSAALSRAFSGRFARIELEVFSSNEAAVRLYEKARFRLEGRKVGARKLDGVIDDILVYAVLKG